MQNLKIIKPITQYDISYSLFTESPIEIHTTDKTVKASVIQIDKGIKNYVSFSGRTEDKHIYYVKININPHNEDYGKGDLIIYDMPTNGV